MNEKSIFQLIYYPNYVVQKMRKNPSETVLK